MQRYLSFETSMPLDFHDVFLSSVPTMLPVQGCVKLSPTLRVHYLAEDIRHVQIAMT